MSHLKRIAAPKSWPLNRKIRKYILRQNPGPHSLETSLSLGFIVKDMLKKGNIAREAKRIVHDGNFTVNGIVRTDVKLPVGLFDMISVPKLDEHYTLLYNRKGKFILVKVSKEDASERVCKIRNKVSLKNNKIQLNLCDGTNMLIDSNDYKPGDSIVISAGKIKRHIKLKKGALVYLTGGQHIGETAVIEEIRVSQGINPNKMILKSGDAMIETIQDYAYVIEKELKK